VDDGLLRRVVRLLSCKEHRAGRRGEVDAPHAPIESVAGAALAQVADAEKGGAVSFGEVSERREDRAHLLGPVKVHAAEEALYRVDHYKGRPDLCQPRLQHVDVGERDPVPA